MSLKMDSLDAIHKCTGLTFESSDEKYTKEILDIFGDKRDQHMSNPALYNYIGISYVHLDKDYNKAKEYFILAIEYNCDANAIINLACFYTVREQNYQNVIKYYLMGIEKHNDKRAMGGLGYFYDVYEKNSVLAEKYYLMAIEHGGYMSIHNLGYLYYDNKKYDEAIKYYLMSIEHGNCTSMYNVGNIYYHLKKYDDALKYYLMALENGVLKALDSIIAIIKYIDIKSCNSNSFIKFCEIDSNNINHLKQYWNKLFNECI